MKLTIEDKFAHIAAWRSSGLIQRQYCELNKINIHTFKSWIQLLNKASTDSETVPTPELVAVENPVATASNQTQNDIIPVIITHQVCVDDGEVENPTHDSPQLRSQTKQPNSQYASALLPARETKPPPEVSLILTSGLQIKCDVRLLSQVLQVVEHA